MIKNRKLRAKLIRSVLARGPGLPSITGNRVPLSVIRQNMEQKESFSHLGEQHVRQLRKSA
jgi:hypothetical protein